ncbi:hypothetical protein LCGC14_3071840 [marine sediment metagenome]|uniref:Uncharacterized protein n=1 Tax=marine sediment metagenome TaxID=412755 RepID=A0A0F8YNG1_9ZZZZ
MKKTLWNRSEIVTNARKFLCGATGKDDDDPVFEKAVSEVVETTVKQIRTMGGTVLER